MYVEKLDQAGDVEHKVRLTEKYESPRQEKLQVNIECIDSLQNDRTAKFESYIPAIKRIEINDKGTKFESNGFVVKMIDGKVEYSSKNPTPPTSARSLKEFFNTLGVNYAFYKVNDKVYELRGHLNKDNVSSTVAVQYRLVRVE